MLFHNCLLFAECLFLLCSILLHSLHFYHKSDASVADGLEKTGSCTWSNQYLSGFKLIRVNCMDWILITLTYCIFIGSAGLLYVLCLYLMHKGFDHYISDNMALKHCNIFFDWTYVILGDCTRHCNFIRKWHNWHHSVWVL